jgi:hypothetical protein
MKVCVATAVALAFAGACLLAQSAVAAGKYDGSGPMICAATAVMECAAGGRCQGRSAESVNFPALFRVDVTAMKAHPLEAEPGRESPIKSVGHTNGKLMLNGADGERGWIALINETTGGISVVVSGDGEGFVIFGQCALS